MLYILEPDNGGAKKKRRRKRAVGDTGIIRSLSNGCSFGI